MKKEDVVEAVVLAKNKKGIAFVGNNSGNYINFIIEKNDNNTIKDIYDCYRFCTHKNIIDETKRQFNMQIYCDEKVKFIPTSNFKSGSCHSFAIAFAVKDFPVP